MTMELDRLVGAAAAHDFESIVQSLDGGPGNFPEPALRQCQRHSTEVTPLLIRAIELATEQRRAGVNPAASVHVFALYLLWEFQAHEALPAIVAAISLPGEEPFDLFGDALTEDLQKILATFSGNQPVTFLDGMIANDALNEMIRWEAARAYVFLVRDGKVSRDVAVERLRHHLRTAIDANDSESPAFLICQLCDLNPQEAVSEIREAFDRDLVEEFIIDREYAEELIAGGEAASRRELARLEPTLLPDTVEHLRNWSWFQPKKSHPSQPISSFLPKPWTPADFPFAGEYESPISSGTVCNESPRVGRNDPCPCGSGKKFKKCCLRNEPLI